MNTIFKKIWRGRQPTLTARMPTIVPEFHLLSWYYFYYHWLVCRVNERLTRSSSHGATAQNWRVSDVITRHCSTTDSNPFLAWWDFFIEAKLRRFSSPNFFVLRKQIEASSTFSKFLQISSFFSNFFSASFLRSLSSDDQQQQQQQQIKRQKLFMHENRPQHWKNL